MNNTDNITKVINKFDLKKTNKNQPCTECVRYLFWWILTTDN